MKKNSRRESGSGSISKRKDGRWQGQFVNGRDPKTGKLRRHTIYGRSQKEVAEKLRAATAAIDKGTYQEPSRITLEEYSEEYMAHYCWQIQSYSICSLISALLSNPSVSPSAAGAAEGKNE